MLTGVTVHPWSGKRWEKWTLLVLFLHHMVPFCTSLMRPSRTVLLPSIKAKPYITVCLEDPFIEMRNPP